MDASMADSMAVCSVLNWAERSVASKAHSKAVTTGATKEYPMVVTKAVTKAAPTAATMVA
jgi:hypothetical protein